MASSKPLKPFANVGFSHVTCPHCLTELVCGISLEAKRNQVEVVVHEDSQETEAYGNERYPPPPGSRCF